MFGDPDSFQDPTLNTFDHLNFVEKKPRKSRAAMTKTSLTQQDKKMMELSGVYPQEVLNRPSQTAVG